MRYLKYATLLGVLLFAAHANAQVRFGVAIGAAPVAVGVGPAPVCAYGYYGYYPYACAPYGYYGPQYFVNGVFLGAGPWYHAPRYYYGSYIRGRAVYAPRRYDRGPVAYGHVHEGYRGNFHDHR
jgi:hypothetical protein